MTIQRRTFLSLLAAVAAKAQTIGKPVNLDEHGDMKLSGVDSASQHAMPEWMRRPRHRQVPSSRSLRVQAAT